MTRNKKCVYNKKKIVSRLMLMKFGDIVVPIDYYNLTKFHQNQLRNKKKLLQPYFGCVSFFIYQSLIDFRFKIDHTYN